MDEGAAQSQSSSPGARLAAAREHAGMTLIQAAERLHLDVATLQALEAGHFQSLGAAVFVRGHLRHYAELVGLPIVEIDAAYAASSARLAPQPDLRRTTTLPGAAASRRVALPPRAALIGAIVLVVIALVWWAMRVPARQRHAATPAPPPPSVSLSPVTAPPPANAVDTGPEPPAAAAPTLHTDAAATSRNSTVASKDAAAPKAVAAQVRLAIRFNEDSWTEVYDARGSMLFHDFGSAGSERRLTGAAPLRVLIGNPNGVALELDGHALVLKPAAESGKPQRFLLESGGRMSEVPAAQWQRSLSAPSTPP
jgi:cytoskeleton protein RodZ